MEKDIQGPQPVQEQRDRLPVQWKIATVRDDRFTMTVVFPDPDGAERITFDSPPPGTE